jgi:hypothetical protein
MRGRNHSLFCERAMARRAGELRQPKAEVLLLEKPVQIIVGPDCHVKRVRVTELRYRGFVSYTIVTPKGDAVLIMDLRRSTYDHFVRVEIPTASDRDETLREFAVRCLRQPAALSVVADLRSPDEPRAVFSVDLLPPGTNLVQALSVQQVWDFGIDHLKASI